MLVSFVALLLSQLTPVTRSTFNNIPPGPVAIMFATVYQYMRLVPPAYHFRIFGVGMSDKIWVYALAAQVGPSRLRLYVLCWGSYDYMRPVMAECGHPLSGCR